MKRNTRNLLFVSLVFALAFTLLGPIAAMAGMWSPGMPLNPAIQKVAQTSACYNIGDSDARSYCLARARRDAGTCYTIQRADMRAQCLAEVRQ